MKNVCNKHMAPFVKIFLQFVSNKKKLLDKTILKNISHNHKAIFVKLGETCGLYLEVFLLK